jgi:hypothetical protein
VTTLRKLWLDEFVDERTGLCSLCGNKGLIDTTGRAVSPAGVSSGRINFCLCPNGRGLKKRMKRGIYDEQIYPLVQRMLKEGVK